MTTRREFLQAGVAACAVPVALSARTAAATALPGKNPLESGQMRFHLVVFDERFSEGVLFARHFERLGIAVRPIRGDMTRVWLDEIEPCWSRRPVSIAGLTAHGPLFCLERLAWDYGMRVVFRDEHAQASDGQMIQTEPLFSWVIAPVPGRPNFRTAAEAANE